MRSLFWKIFLIFWLSNIVISAFAISLRWAQTGNSHQDRIATLYEHAELAADQLEQNGPRGLRHTLHQLSKEHGIQAFLIGANGHSYGHPPPPHVMEQIERIPQTITPLQNKAGPFFIHAVEVQLESKKRYRFIAMIHPPSGQRGRPGPLFWMMASLLAAITLASFLIARLITRPLRTMQSVTARFASGNRNARIPENIATRKDAIGDLGREFNALAHQVDALLSTQQQLLRDVSHELRSPLARIEVALALLEKRVSDADPAELSRIQTEVERLDKLIGQVLTLSRLESGSEHLNIETIALKPLLEHVIDDCEFEFNDDATPVTLNCEDDLMLNCDPEKFRSAVENVLRNALRYTATDTEVELNAQRDSVDRSKLTIRVADHGPGVPQQDLARLFDPFYRVGEARDEHSGGHGVGLSIARQVINLHGGDVQADNRPGGGLMVTFTLPLHKANTH